MTRVVTRFEPARDFLAWRNAMERLFDDSTNQGWTSLARRPSMVNNEWRLPVDAYSTPEEVVIMASVPGVNPENVEITFDNDVLTIRGEFAGQLENVEYQLNERRHGRFSRSLSFTTPINAEAIEATFENGVLTIVAPKAETVKPKTIKVNAK